VQLVHCILELYAAQLTSKLIGSMPFAAHPLLPVSKVTGVFVGLDGSQVLH